MSAPNATHPNLEILQGDNLTILEGFAEACFDFIYIDPPFNTGKTQRHTRTTSKLDPEGNRVGFGGRRYQSEQSEGAAYQDTFSDFEAFLWPRLEQARRVLKPNGSLFLHIDYREAHYCKVMLDRLFGRDNFLNEIIWAYDYGGRSKKRWSTKHDSLFWYVKDTKNYTFNFEEMDRIPYMAPGLVGKEKAARGKTPTDVWWHTIVPTNGKERVGYPTQKPLGLIERIIKVHTRPGDRVLDFFAGSGTTGEAAIKHGRSAVLIDQNPEAISIMHKRLNRVTLEQGERP